MRQSPSTEAGQANEVDGDGPWKRDSNGDSPTVGKRNERRGQPAVAQPTGDESVLLNYKTESSIPLRENWGEPTSSFSWRLIKNAKF